MKILLGNISEFLLSVKLFQDVRFFLFVCLFLDVSFAAISWYDSLAVK